MDSLSSVPKWAQTRISGILEQKSAGSGRKVPAENPVGYSLGQVMIGDAKKAIEDMVSIDGSSIDQDTASASVDASKGENRLKGAFTPNLADDVLGTLNDPEANFEATSYRKMGETEFAFHIQKQDGVFTVARVERVSLTETGAIFMEMGPKNTDGFIQASD